MAEKIIITGINGFVGEHVARDFKQHGYMVFGTGREAIPASKVSDLLDGYVEIDLLDERHVKEALSFSDVAAVVHLAGLANVGQSFERPREYIANNGIIAFNLLEKALADNMPGRAVIVSSGALYDPMQPLPLHEASLTNPSSPYAIGKLMTEQVAYYFKNKGLDTVVARPFNHTGPGQLPGFLIPDLYQKVSEAEPGATIHVGNLNTKRDYTDVRDIARAYTKLAIADTLHHNLYNISSGSSIAGIEIFKLIQKSLNRHDVTYEVDQTLIRPNDAMDSIGDSSRIQNELGWKPEISIDQTISDFCKLHEGYS